MDRLILSIQNRIKSYENILATLEQHMEIKKKEKKDKVSLSPLAEIHYGYTERISELKDILKESGHLEEDVLPEDPKPKKKKSSRKKNDKKATVYSADEDSDDTFPESEPPLKV